MKAAVVYGKEDIRYMDWEMPEVGPGDVLIRVRACGICGSDVPRVNEGTAHSFPLILGHEFSGDVVRVGEKVTKVKVGDKVTGAGLLPCMKCKDCARGDYALCTDYSFIGIWQHGAFAQFVAMPEMCVVKLDEKIPYDIAALFEPATVALHGLRRLDFQPGDSVAVLGCGTIGLFTIQWAKIFGAKQVVAFDLSPKKLDRALEYGADAVVNTLEPDFMEKAKALTNGRGFRYVIEVAGSAATMKMSFELVENRGGVCIVGTQGKDITFPPKLFELLSKKEFTLTGARMSYGPPFPGAEWTLTAHFLKTGALRADESFIYRKFPLSQAKDAFELFKKERVDGKVMFIMD